MGGWQAPGPNPLRRFQRGWYEDRVWRRAPSCRPSRTHPASLLITSNLAFSDWGQVFQGERMTAALLDRLTHRCHIFEMNGESYRFRDSIKAKKRSPKDKNGKKPK